MELETINKLYLELSQVATAKTKRELSLERTIYKAYDQIMGATYLDEDSAADAAGVADDLLELIEPKE